MDKIPVDSSRKIRKGSRQKAAGRRSLRAWARAQSSRRGHHFSVGNSKGNYLANLRMNTSGMLPVQRCILDSIKQHGVNMR